MWKVEIVAAPALELAGVAYRGPYAEIGGAFGRLHEILTARSLYRDGQHNVAVYFDDVAVTAPADCRSFAGRSIAPGTSVQPPLERLELAGGDYARLRFVGPYAELGNAYGWLIGAWLPSSGRAASDRPCYEVYLNTPMEAEPQGLVTDIHLPLA